MNTGKRGGSLAEINVTPLVDVLLVLLIIFMVTAPMIHHGAKLSTPDMSEGQPDTPDQKEEKSTLVLLPSGKVRFRGQELLKEELLEMLRGDPLIQKNKELYLRADPEMNYGRVMEIIGIMRRAGVTRLGVVVRPEDLQELPAKK